MKLILESTDRIVNASGIDCRVWVGKTERGIEVQALIPRVAVIETADCSQFEAELKEQHAPSSGQNAFPLRMVL